MKKYFEVGLFAFGFILLISSAPETSENKSVSVKIGIFELQKIMRESKVIAGYRDQIGKEMESKKKVFTQKQEAVRKLEDKLIKEIQKLSLEEKASLEEKLGNEVKELKRLKEDMDQDIQKMDRQLTQKAFQRINEEIRKLAIRDRYMVVFEKNAGGVAYFNNALDVSGELIKLIDK